MKSSLKPMGVGVVILALGVGGCAIWESNRHPDYQSTRAAYICHPYGNCYQGQWGPVDSLGTDQPEATVSHSVCRQEIDRGHEEDVWWDKSVTRGLEIETCMLQKGFRLVP
ncbi:MAG: hypothetical protein KC590_01035 [Nitrospira sp.]|nr:hypothetical protein [Nitrospira sp.]